MIARSITIVAPIVNEWQAPFPIVVMVIFSLIGLFTGMTFPDQDEFVPGNPLKEKKYNMRENNKKGENGSDISYRNLSRELRDENSNTQDDHTTNDQFGKIET